MDKVKPISPADIKKLKAEYTPPDFVVNVVNDLIKQKNSTYFTIKQDAIVSALEALGYARSEIFDSKWLDIEPAFNKVGWKVTYDKPGYCESYDAFFQFEAK